MILLNLIAVVAFVVAVVVVWRRLRFGRTVFTWLSAMQGWSLVSCFYNDLSVANLELFRWTETTAATSLLALAYIGLTLGVGLVAHRFEHLRFRPVAYDWGIGELGKQLFRFMIWGVSATILAVLGFDFLLNGVPIMTMIDRAAYWEQAGPIASILPKYGYLLYFALGLVRPRVRRLTVEDGLMLALVLCLLAIGNKFSAFVIVAVGYGTPVLAALPVRKVVWTRQWLRYAMIAFGLSLPIGLAVVHYSTKLNDSGLVMALVKQRVFAFQGHVWWGTYYATTHEGRSDPRQLEREVRGVLDPGSVPIVERGLRRLMVELIGPERAYTAMAHGYLYTMGYPAILLLMIPHWLIPLIQFLCGILFALSLWWLHSHIVAGHYFRAILVFTLVWPLGVTLLTGNFAHLLSIGLAARLAVVVLLDCGLLATGKGRSLSADIAVQSSTGGRL